MSADSPSSRLLAMIVAASDNDVIGVAGDLPWHLSSDLQRFKQLTMGHALLMGRKTFDSIGRLLPGRTTIVFSRQSDWEFPGALVVGALEEALAACPAGSTPFLVGGAEIYRLGLPRVGELYLTRVHTTVEGDTWLPELDWGQWQLVSRESFPAGPRNDHPFSFEHYRRA